MFQMSIVSCWHLQNFLSAVSEKPDLVSCEGISVIVLGNLGKVPLSKVGLRHLYTIHTLQIEIVMNEP